MGQAFFLGDLPVKILRHSAHCVGKAIPQQNLEYLGHIVDGQITEIGHLEAFKKLN